ncbi:antirestriction protein [Metapseudomonas furukawaii]|uniref:Antirestriction protein n=1 Tax=Metapseudomonas furukawaii TaxID=1149133 RepID=A0AAD1C799_METFU|nr:antirestriction protein [Pseudomonas furukawaii]ELS27572.1 KlcA protein [Pseudomonas furukawaii]BAU77424.1 antirestriction protein [Pseudomonas furukawaii]
MSTQATLSPIECRRVPVRLRMSVLPRHFDRQMLNVERNIMNALRELCDSYNGGYWEYYELSNGGFYMAPNDQDAFCLSCQGNGYEGELSADAAGIVASLFGLCRAANTFQTDNLINHYHWLRDFALAHAEADAIFAAID